MIEKMFHESCSHRLSSVAAIFVTFLVFAAGTLGGSPCLGQETSQEQTSSELLTFAHLGYFSNRGLMIGMFAYSRTTYGLDRPVSGQGSSLVSKFSDAPEELRDLLKPRETNRLESQLDVFWLEGMAEDESNLQETLARLSRFGFIELFRHQNSRLFDKPLVTRKKLMDRQEKIARQMAQLHAGLIGHGLTKNEELVLVGQMRSLSVEFDLSLLAALSPKERSRVSKLVSVAIPVTIDQIKQDNKKFGPFGFGDSK